MTVAKIYRYFVSYAHGDGALGFGNSEIHLDGPITKFDQIAAIKNFLQNNGARKVTVLAWQLLDDPAPLQEMVADAIQEHAENAPHLYPDGSSR